MVFPGKIIEKLCFYPCKMFKKCLECVLLFYTKINRLDHFIFCRYCFCIFLENVGGIMLLPSLRIDRLYIIYVMQIMLHVSHIICTFCISGIIINKVFFL